MFLVHCVGGLGSVRAEGEHAADDRGISDLAAKVDHRLQAAADHALTIEVVEVRHPPQRQEFRDADQAVYGTFRSTDRMIFGTWSKGKWERLRWQRTMADEDRDQRIGEWPDVLVAYQDGRTAFFKSSGSPLTESRFGLDRRKPFWNFAFVRAGSELAYFGEALMLQLLIHPYWNIPPLGSGFREALAHVNARVAGTETLLGRPCLIVRFDRPAAKVVGSIAVTDDEDAVVLRQTMTGVAADGREVRSVYEVSELATFEDWTYPARGELRSGDASNERVAIGAIEYDFEVIEVSKELPGQFLPTDWPPTTVVRNDIEGTAEEVGPRPREASVAQLNRMSAEAIRVASGPASASSPLRWLLIHAAMLGLLLAAVAAVAFARRRFSWSVRRTGVACAGSMQGRPWPAIRPQHGRPYGEPAATRNRRTP